jgi:hypothetical protein
VARSGARDAVQLSKHVLGHLGECRRAAAVTQQFVRLQPSGAGKVVSAEPGEGHPERRIRVALGRCPVGLQADKRDGVLRPQPRWSNCTKRYFSGSNELRRPGELPLPGPPWRATAGFPKGLPLTSQ